ncbi:hypothetical protein DXV75_12315 [Alteromonas aestuariivivens]|uniref:Catalase n=1 Tax=Alteromonas aestuariivivens TaxID=1938339 RepID=A0A3D8M6R4_9ALTE|nr:putative metalloprotease CJM1_0395 family protein [Alteromonas aestuariivivens]RDV24852.1 hypothetical protein DXV75_12315 [Alteromonas aestuariivivens]
MSLVTPLPTTLAYPTANVNTEAARRDNALRETIPQSSNPEQGASGKGLGSESDKARNPGQPPHPVTYERPHQAGEVQPDASSGDGLNRDNGQQQSAGRDDAEQRQQDQQEQRKIEQLKARDAEVRQHEQAHANTGGQYAGTPRYDYEMGPDGKRYAVGGEVSIDVSEAPTPEQTIRKMQQVRDAALAPAEPSVQDLKVASEAMQKANQARAELASDQSAQSNAAGVKGNVEQAPPSLEQIVQEGGVSAPRRTFQGLRDAVSEGMSTRTLAMESHPLQQRINRIQQFYQSVSDAQDTGFSASA